MVTTANLENPKNSEANKVDNKTPHGIHNQSTKSKILNQTLDGATEGMQDAIDEFEPNSGQKSNSKDHIHTRTNIQGINPYFSSQFQEASETKPGIADPQNLINLIPA